MNRGLEKKIKKYKILVYFVTFCKILLELDFFLILAFLMRNLNRLLRILNSEIQKLNIVCFGLLEL